ncbi:MAG TPA: YqhG family protein [Bacillota bacterium]|nr:YqhG family protein [Bacillota bacterium]
MPITNLNTFLSRFFNAHHCTILRNEDGVMTVQLTEEMDQSLMNRPFYWHYVKKMGKMGEPMKLTFITNPSQREQQGEWIHFGSPRLQHILHLLKTRERFTKLFQSVRDRQSLSKTELHPWLVVNIKITYVGQQTKAELFSIGLNLVNGEMKSEMMNHLKHVDLQTTIGDYCYTISPLITIRSGFKRIQSVIDNYVRNKDYEWAHTSQRELKKEIQLLNYFYEGKSEEEKEQQAKEIREITKRFKPRISISIINGGLFYLVRTM